MINFNRLVRLYRKELKFDYFYDIVQHRNRSKVKDFFHCDRLLAGYKFCNSKSSKIKVNQKDERIDVPVWFADPPSPYPNRKSRNSKIPKDWFFEGKDISDYKCRIIVYGIEPYPNNNPKFQIEKVKNRVYSAPFGIDRWGIKTSGINKYYNVFKDLTCYKDSFVLFTDVYKSYKIDGKKNKFNREASKHEDVIKKEISIIDPTTIVALGNDAFNKLHDIFQCKYDIRKLTHPAARGNKKKGIRTGDKIAKEQIANFLSNEFNVKDKLKDCC